MAKVIDRFKIKYGKKKTFLFIEELLYRYDNDQVSEIGAQLAYYLILSIFPFLIFFLNLLQFTPLADTQVLQSMLSVLPVESQKLLYDLITEILSNSTTTLLSVGALGSIWSASNGTLAIIKAVNRAYDFDEDRPYWKIRGLSIIFTIGLFIILVVSFSIVVFGEAIYNKVFTNYGLLFLLIWKVIKILLPLVFMIIVLSLLYSLAPSIKDGIEISIKDTLAGSIFSSIGILLSSMIFSTYINNFGNYTKTYGSIGGIITLLIWMYISSIIIVLGAEVNATILSMKTKTNN